MANKLYSMIFTTGDPRDTFALTPTLVRFYNLSTGGVITAPGITQSGLSSGIFHFEYQPTFSSIAFIADGGAAAPSRYLAGALDPIQLIDYQATTLTAIGTTNFALGTTSVALGITGVALGTSNIALGVTNVALGTTNVALGTSGVALGTTGVAIGTTLTGYGVSIYAGTQTLLAIGFTSTAIGVSILAVIGTTASSIGTTNADPVDLFGHLKRTQEFLEGNAQFTKTSGLWEIKTRGSTLFATKTLANAVTTVTKT